jgi:phage N-6-adenine-methyltransferase
MMPAQKPGRSKQDYQTPAQFLRAVKARFLIEDFDIDLAATRDFDSMTDTSVTERCYTEQDNALVQPWKVGNGWNWLNPPFGRIEPWVQRAYEQARDYDARTLVLVPASVGANWWRDWVHDKAFVHLLHARLSFDGKAPFPKDCALLEYSRAAAYDLFDRGSYYTLWDWRKDVPAKEQVA